MWLVNFLPSWFFYILTLAGVAGFVASYVLRSIPFIGANAFGVKVASIAAILIGVWFSGAAYNNATWEARVKEMEAKVAEAEAQSKVQNKRLDDALIAKSQAIKSRKQDIVRYIDREIVKYDGQCVIPNEFIVIHNRAAEQPR